MKLEAMSAAISQKNEERVSGSLIAAGAVALLLLLATAAGAQTPDYKKIYPKMAPIGDYLMNRDAEIALARTAAPEAISGHATVMVLGRHGWETAVRGTNGFVCMVERGWSSSIDFPEMWNPKIKGADCLNAAAARTIVPVVEKLTSMALAGETDAQRAAGIKEAFAKKQIPPLEAGTMGYMMSKESYLTDGQGHNLPHLMIFTPARQNSEWGAGAAHSPVVTALSYWFGNGDKNPLNRELPPLRVFIVAVPMWSDGSPAM